MCSHELMWESDWCQSDIDETLNEDEDSYVMLFRCPHCGCEVELSYPSEQDKFNFPYWNNEK